jgi:hypothetical protein
MTLRAEVAALSSNSRQTAASLREFGHLVGGESSGSPSVHRASGESGWETLERQVVYAAPYARKCGMPVFI